MGRVGVGGGAGRKWRGIRILSRGDVFLVFLYGIWLWDEATRLPGGKYDRRNDV